jgi:hypothetical protein
LAQTADPWYRELTKTHLETRLKTFEKHFSPLNCTSSHFIRKDLAYKWFETNFFNEIKDLEASLHMPEKVKLFINEALSTRSESVCLSRTKWRVIF